ncbi:MAG: hypothetical protein Q9161_001529 [Pseudevernia consocians]
MTATKVTTPKTHTTNSKRPKPTHTHKTAKHTSIKTGNDTIIGSLGDVGTSVPPFLGTNPSAASSRKTELPHGTGPHRLPPHGPPPHGPPGGSPAFPASSLSALEASAVASPTTSSAGIVTYQNLVGNPIESGAVPPSSTEFAGVPPPDLPSGPPTGLPGGPPGGPPLCPPPVTVTSTSITTITLTEPAPVTPLTTATTVQLSSAPFRLGNSATTLHGSTGGTDTGLHLITIRTTVSAKSSIEASDKGVGKSSDNTSAKTSAKNSATTAVLSSYH